MTDEEIIDEALRWYADARHSFADKIGKKGALVRGRTPSGREVANAIILAKKVDDLIRRRKIEKYK